MDKEIQKILNKLISEEWIAGQLYKLFIQAIKPEYLSTVFDAFEETATDEINDHMANLIVFARKYKYTIPVNYKDFNKFAGKDDVKQFESFKSDQDAKYYLEEAIASEQRAIATYADIIKKLEEMNQTDKLIELISICTNNWYDEIEHSNTFLFLKYQVEALNIY